MSGALIPGPYFIKLIHLPVLSILNPGPDFIYLSPGPDFIKLVRVRILSILSPVRIISRQSGRRVRVRILSICESGSGSGFYPSSPGRGPDFIYF